MMVWSDIAALVALIVTASGLAIAGILVGTGEATGKCYISGTPKGLELTERYTRWTEDRVIARLPGFDGSEKLAEIAEIHGCTWQK